ncbi:MAG: SDR family oxidoreductase [Acidimicrobiia bacterium]
MDLGLKDRAVAVAGGTRGIGRAVAEALADEGCRVAVLARTESDLRATEEALAAKGVEAVGLECDLRVGAEVDAAFTFLAERFGELTALVNAAGPAALGTFSQLDDQSWLDSFDTSVLSVVRTIRAALPLLRKATFGRIVNIAASSIRHQSPSLVGYTAAKSALASVSKSLARELAPEGILVNTVCPGTVMNPELEAYVLEATADDGTLPQGPLEAAYVALAREHGSLNDIGRIGLPEEVAALVTFLCSEPASYMVGAMVPIDGGTDF